MMNGILNVYKEKGFTSHDVVAKLRGICRQRKIGHTGTLDPDAVGVLPVCLGNATKLCDVLIDTNKAYEVTFQLGIVTDTQDNSGTILEEHEVNITPEEAEKVIFSFLGDYEQIPPMYSAKKVNGKKLYELAREGKVIDRKPCPIVIYEIKVIDIKLPFISMSVDCSKGTYIRTLCHDIGNKLGCGATMIDLKRVKAGVFEIEDSLSLSEIEEMMKDGVLDEKCRLVDEMFPTYPRVYLDEKFDRLIYNGNSFYRNQLKQIQGDYHKNNRVLVYDSKATFVGIYDYTDTTEGFSPFKMFLSNN